MSISKISRSLVVIIFVALILFMGYEDVLLLLNNSNNSTTANILKVVYVIATVLLVLLYVYIKDKLYRKKVKRNISLVYRYIYISFIVIIMSVISIYRYLYLINNITLGIYILLKLIIAIVLKKVIFNVSKSDILSVLGMFAFSILPCVYITKINLFINLINTIMILSSIFVIQKLIDELKQRGIKNKKYLILSLILGVLVSITIILGVHFLVWVAIALISLFLTANLDNTHIGFPKKIISIVNKKTKDTLYKVERVNISKLFICIILIAIISCGIVTASSYIIRFTHVDNSKIGDFINLNTNIFNIDFNKFIPNLISNTNNILSTSKTFYIFMFLYIVFIEVLSVILHRRYDTKSTIIKIFFVTLYISISIFEINILNYQVIFTTLLILIAIVNTSNIYLNREERIKMLVA